LNNYLTKMLKIDVQQAQKLGKNKEKWKRRRYLSMKDDSLFVLFYFVLMKSIKLGCFKSCSWSLWKALEEEGCIGLVSWRLDLWCKSSWIMNDFFIKWECGRYWFVNDFYHLKFNKFQKIRFWKEKSVEDVVMLEPMA
jgi:hypothetical protein